MISRNVWGNCAWRSECLTLSQFPLAILANPSKLRIYIPICKIPAVITETWMVHVNHALEILISYGQLSHLLQLCIFMYILSIISLYLTPALNELQYTLCWLNYTFLKFLYHCIYARIVCSKLMMNEHHCSSMNSANSFYITPHLFVKMNQMITLAIRPIYMFDKIFLIEWQWSLYEGPSVE
jgi:hypothetical protein